MIVIRDAEKTDLSLLSIFNQAMAMETEDRPLSENLLNGGINAVFDNPQLGFYLIASVDQSVAGALMVTTEWSDWRNGLFWWIQSVYVLPEFRREGVFRALYDNVRAKAHANESVCGLRLYVEQQNENARQTYQAMGMIETPYRLYEEEF